MSAFVAALFAALAPVIREVLEVFMARAAGPAVSGVTDAAPKLDTLDTRATDERNTALVARFRRDRP